MKQNLGGLRRTFSRGALGFTLVEILVTLLLMAAVMAFTMPSLARVWQELRMDLTIHQIHRDLRWAQEQAFRMHRDVTVLFYQDRQPYRYMVRMVGMGGKNLRYRTLPGNLDRIEAQSVQIFPDKRFRKNNHILLQKGAYQRYVYYYTTGRSRVVKKALE